MSKVIGRAHLIVRSGLALYKELALSAATLLPRRRAVAPRLETRTRAFGS